MWPAILIERCARNAGLRDDASLDVPIFHIHGVASAWEVCITCEVAGDERLVHCVSASRGMPGNAPGHTSEV